MRVRKLSLAMMAVIGLVLITPTLAAEKEKKEKQPRTSVDVKVDPRVELFSIIFRLAGNPEYSQGRVKAYTKDVESHFDPFRDHAVVGIAGKLRNTTGVSYDAPMSLAVHLDAETFETKMLLDPWPEGIDRRWNAESVGQFLEAARQFVRDTSYKEFFAKHEPLYKIAESRMREALQKEAHLEWFDEFFGERPSARFTVVLGMLNGGSCYGSHCRTADGKEELYCILGVWKTDSAGKPQFDVTGVMPTIVHEFCHSYANPLIFRHEEELKTAGEKLYKPVASAMKSQAYGSGKTVLLESLVRACVVRYIHKYDGEKAAEKEVQRQTQRKFASVAELSKLLAEYESQRDRYSTLETFSPQLVAFFNEYADKFSKEAAEKAALQPKVISVVPSNGDQNVDPDLKAIKVVFDRPMRDKAWSLVGGGPHFPETTGKCAYDSKCTTWTCPIKLKPDWNYTFRLNFGYFQAFQSRDGVPLEPVVVSFRTAKKKEDAGKVEE